MYQIKNDSITIIHIEIKKIKLKSISQVKQRASIASKHKHFKT